MNRKSNWRVKARAFFAASTVLIFLTTFTAISIVPAKAGTCTGSFPADNLWKPIRSPIGNVLIDADSDLSATGDRRSNVDIMELRKREIRRRQVQLTGTRRELLAVLCFAYACMRPHEVLKGLQLALTEANGLSGLELVLQLTLT